MSHAKVHVVHELVRRGLLDRTELVDGGVTVVDSTSRHRNSQVIRKAGGGYFVKEAIPTQTMSLQTLMREASTYAIVQNGNGPLASLAAIMPRYHLWDPQQRLLVLELLSSAETLGAQIRRTSTFSPASAADFGRALATYHGQAAGNAMSTLGQLFPRSLPWALTFSQQSAGAMQGLSGANNQMFSLIQRYPNFPARLDALQKTWRRDTLIHGDLKFENLMLSYASGTDAPAGIRVVDWEVADVGDPRWDVGSMLQSWLSYWIFSMPADGSVTGVEQLAAQAQYPLEAMRPAIHAFWRAYTDTMRVSDGAERELLDTCISFGAARMVQTVFESMYQSPQLTPHAIFMLQVSLNILEQPSAAVAELLVM
jgi:hypothetical protein